MPNGYSNDEANALVDASPLNYANTNSPYTILAYGNGISCPNNEMGDGTVPYSQATSLAAQLAANKYTLFTLNGVDHNTFGEGETVYPGATDKVIHEYYYGKEDDEGEIIEPGLKQLIAIYLLGNTNTNG